MAVIGKNILENLTTGMYSDSKIIYREYIQNACDQIDAAVASGILSPGEGSVEILIESKNRHITIMDNATGVSKEIFKAQLGDIANSDKQIGKDKGFRGIGRLSGLAYCTKLVFTTSYSGEATRSVMTWDAKLMRKLLADNQKHTVDEVLEQIVDFSEAEEDPGKHYFHVELIGINAENTDLLNRDEVLPYLSFVAPVPYKNTFLLRNDVYQYAHTIGFHIDEYDIRINGEQVLKEYGGVLYEPSGQSKKSYDEVKELEFKNFYARDGSLLGWLWFGLSTFDKQIPAINLMRGIRLRQGNIQIGDSATLRELFKETRGIFYFIGEVFAAHKDLIPNSQRNYFNENEMRVEFENALRDYFYSVLHKLYTDANERKNDYKRQTKYINMAEDYEEKVKNNDFIDEEDRQRKKFELEKAQQDAEKAIRKLERIQETEDEDSPLTTVRKNIAEAHKSEKLDEKVQRTQKKMETIESRKDIDGDPPYMTANLPKLTKSEQRLVSRIYSIIKEIATEEFAEALIRRIQEELK